MTIKNIFFLSSMIAISSLHIICAPTPTVSSPTKLAPNPEAFKLFFKQYLQQAARQQNTTVQQLVQSKKHVMTEPAIIKQPQTTIKAAAAQASLKAKQKTKLTKATAKTNVAVSR